MFDKLFGRKKSEGETTSPPAPAGAGPIVIDLRSGRSYDQATTPEAVDDLVASGELEMVYLISPMFGGMPMPMNQVAAPRGAAEAVDRINEQVRRAMESGADVGTSISPDYGEGSSRVPRQIDYDFGAAGHWVIKSW